eukprot:CAMPEP_0195106746 /NCGR_PEP_ID=MMETSP0448-20130528/81669_1 /TAXON_ID=66468 /ORGANISM="Heterocapsa triquestra, Strain CCMP 448" /LENGTH=82 /DNA_ID=CAMNT_0040143071 /DNA_START=39 /DNA_END=287 /DNA_ORIENTATION=-
MHTKHLVSRARLLVSALSTGPRRAAAGHETGEPGSTNSLPWHQGRRDRSPDLGGRKTIGAGTSPGCVQHSAPLAQPWRPKGA